MLALILVHMIPYLHEVLVVFKQAMLVPPNLFLNELLSVVLHQHLVRQVWLWLSHREWTFFETLALVED